MKVVLTRGLWVNNKHYVAGHQEIPDAELKHGHFVKYIKAGFVQDGSVVRKVTVKTPSEKGEALIEKLHARMKKDMSPEEAQAQADAAAPAEESKPEVEVSAKDAKPSKKK